MLGQNIFRDTEIYAGNAQCAVVPEGTDRCNGVCVGYSLPAKWWNGMWRDTTTKLHSAYSMISSIYGELSSVIINSGQVVGASTTQLRNILYGSSVILGEGSSSECTDAVVIGGMAYSCGCYSVAIGYHAKSYGESGIAIGNNTASYSNSLSIGNNAQGYCGGNNILIGSNIIDRSNMNCQDEHFIIGYCNILLQNKAYENVRQFLIGNKNNLLCSDHDFIVGSYNRSVGSGTNHNFYNIIMGRKNTVSYSNATNRPTSGNIIFGDANCSSVERSIIIGSGNESNKAGSILIGKGNIVCKGNWSTANESINGNILIGCALRSDHARLILINPNCDVYNMNQLTGGIFNLTYRAGTYTQEDVVTILSHYIKDNTTMSVIGFYSCCPVTHLERCGNVIYFYCNCGDLYEYIIRITSNRCILCSNFSILGVPNYQYWN